MKLELAPALTALKPALNQVFDLAAAKISALDRAWDSKRGTPVFTVTGQYTTRGWTEWTQGFQYGMAILQFDGTGDRAMLDMGRRMTTLRMAPHVSHIGVHDHGFNNVSTYGNLRRLMREGKIAHNQSELDFYEMALKASGAVQAARWTSIPGNPAERPTDRDTGYIHSFNGPHSLFSDTIRSVRALMVAWQLNHALMGENDRAIDLLKRGLQHGLTTAQYNVYYGKGRDVYDTPAEAGRVVHESIFNVTDGRYRCPSTQQGYSPFSTWTRGLAWILCGYAEDLEFLETLRDEVWLGIGMDTAAVLAKFTAAAQATAEWYIKHSFDDGMVYWDAGAPGIPTSNNYQGISDPYNNHEPMDSSAAAIAAQGFFRLANVIRKTDGVAAERYRAAALLIAKTLFATPYLATDPTHQGLLLHSVYHRPNNWDHIPAGKNIPCGESSMWGDYHGLELALLLKRAAENQPYYVFFDR
jgi:unsaturated chondroitin disaccharide hydrolase